MTGKGAAVAVVATHGDRLVLSHIAWRGGQGSPAFETEKIHLTEVDADGKLKPVILFDPEDRIDAFVESMRRFAEGEAEGNPSVFAAADMMAQIRQNGWNPRFDALPLGFVMEDHRPLCFGRIDAKQWEQSVRGMEEPAPGSTIEFDRVFAWKPRSLLMRARNRGTRKDGGAFENVYLLLAFYSEGGPVRTWVYPEDDLGLATARLHELSEELDAAGS